MKEFTIRQKSTRPILSLTPAMLQRMLQARPESVSLVLAKQAQDYKQITGKSLSVDYDQTQALLAHAGADARGMWANRYSELPHPLSQVPRIFADGFMRRTVSEGMCEDLALAEAFHALLDIPLRGSPDTGVGAK